MRTWITAAALGSALLGGAGTMAAQAQEAARPAPPPPPGGPLMDADADGDGVVTREEVIAAADRRFAAIDADHDGKIDAGERHAHRDRHRPMRPGPDGDGPPPPPDASGSAPPPPPPPMGVDRDAPPPPDAGRHDDRRHHGRHPRPRAETQAQFRERALKLFERADTNHDGRVDAREREAMELLVRARRIGENGERRDGPPAPPAG